MEEYESNFDYDHILDCFHFSPPSESQIFLLPPLPQPQSSFHHQLPQNSHEKKELPTAAQTVSMLPTANSLKSQERIVKGEMEFQWEVRQRWQTVRQGNKDDTVELNINFKTIIVSYFRPLLLANELSPKHAQKLAEFTRRPPSFKSLIEFCSGGEEGEGIARLCLELVQSSGVMMRVLSSRCRLSTKKQMIKFMQVLRWNLRGGRIRRWKQNPLN